jgi:glutaredoxin
VFLALEGGDMKSVLITVLMLAALQSAAAGELYRWVDKSGVVHYGDIPANDAQQLETKTYSEPAPAPSPSSFALEKAKKNFPVTLYVIRNCGGACKQAHDFLAKFNIPYTEVLLQNQEQVNEFKQKSGSDLSPTLSVGKDWLKGFQPDEWQDELNVAGYPGVAPSPTSAQGVPPQ